MALTPKEYKEATFRQIISICYDATGGNAAFEPKYGLHVLNRIRIELDLDMINTGYEQQDIKTMEELLDY